MILIYWWDLITEPWPNQSSLGQSLQHPHFHQKNSFDIDIFMRLDNWTLTKPEFSGAVFTVIVPFTRKKCDMDTFLRFDNWTLTKPELSGAVFRVVVTFTWKKIVILMHFWDLITEPWPNQCSLGQSLQPSSLSPEKFLWYWYFFIWSLNLGQTKVLWGSLYRHRHFHPKNFVIWIHFSDLITEPWPNQSSLGQSLESSSLSPEKKMWYWYICEIW